MIKKIIYLIGILTIVGVAGLLVFKYAIPHDTQREVIRELGMEDVPIINEATKASFIDHDVTEARKSFSGDKWVFTTVMRNANSSVNIYKVKLRYNFTDGSEDRWYNVDLRPGRALPSIATDRIPGHSGGEYISVEILDAE